LLALSVMAASSKQNRRRLPRYPAHQTRETMFSAMQNRRVRGAIRTHRPAAQRP
jgi:hypothetical protein